MFFRSTKCGLLGFAEKMVGTNDFDALRWIASSSGVVSSGDAGSDLVRVHDFGLKTREPLRSFCS
jgi:hypothetical protein